MLTEYLGLWVSNEGLRPLLSKVDTINKIDAPTKVHDVLMSVGIVNHNSYMWRNRDHTLAPLTK